MHKISVAVQHPHARARQSGMTGTLKSMLLLLCKHQLAATAYLAASLLFSSVVCYTAAQGHHAAAPASRSCYCRSTQTTQGRVSLHALLLGCCYYFYRPRATSHRDAKGSLACSSCFACLRSNTCQSQPQPPAAQLAAVPRSSSAAECTGLYCTWGLLLGAA
jgi:hypothetical protein